MAGNEAQKQLLTLIRGFASEKSQGEKRVIGLKKRIEDLQSELEAANLELEDAKRFKETTEQELKGLEVELAVKEASIQALEGRISLIQDEISTVGSEVEALKEEEAAIRDKFIGLMFGFNAKIRKLQEAMSCDFQEEETVSIETEVDRNVDDVSKALEETLSHIVSQIAKEEEEYLSEQNIQKKVQLDLVNVERKTSEMEKSCTFLSEELKKKCICPNCHLDNLRELGGILKGNEAN
ncbi:hypothetical protein SLE2022_192690 [Rubroshorea leprosula]